MESIISSPIRCSTLLVEAVPLVMRSIRAEMRKQHMTDLSVPQFRALVFVGNNPGTTLSDAADYVGLSLPAMSKMIESLVQRDLVRRQEGSEDRRKVHLSLTAPGTTLLMHTRRRTQADLAEKLRGLSDEELAAVEAAMGILCRVFTPD